MKKEERLLAIDYGLRRIGLALSDARQVIASPLPTLLASKKMEQTVSSLCAIIAKIEAEYGCSIVEVVIGLPLLLSGKDGVLADEVRLFSSQLEQKISCPIVLWDERFTTVLAERSLKERNMSRKKRAKVVDAVSAVLLLQSYLDSKKTFPS